MQKKTKIALAAGLAGILGLGTLAGVAVADGGWGGGHGMGGGHGKGRMAQQMMERYDANKDGKVSQEETPTAPSGTANSMPTRTRHCRSLSSRNSGSRPASSRWCASSSALIAMATAS